MLFILRVGKVKTSKEKDNTLVCSAVLENPYELACEVKINHESDEYVSSVKFVQMFLRSRAAIPFCKVLENFARA